MSARHHQPAFTARAACMLLLAMLAGCATDPGVSFVAGEKPKFWPAPPEEPRFSYIGSLVGSEDLRPARSGLDAVGDFLFGREKPRGMVSPIGVCTNGAERLFVVDSGERAVHVFDLDTQKYQQWAPPEGAPPLVLPVAVAFDADRARVIVADSGDGSLRCFTLEGKPGPTLAKGVLKRPCGLAIHKPTGNIYVADVADHSIVELTPEGAEVRRIGGRGGGPGEFNFPTFIAFDSRDFLYVSDSLNFRIVVLDAQRNFVRHIGRKGDLPGYFSQPKGVALDPEDHLYVVDANFEAFQVFDTSGTLLLAIGQEGHAPGEFWLPAGIAADAKGRIWIADSYNRRVQVFQYLSRGGEK